MRTQLKYSHDLMFGPYAKSSSTYILIAYCIYFTATVTAKPVLAAEGWKF